MAMTAYASQNTQTAEFLSCLRYMYTQVVHIICVVAVSRAYYISSILLEPGKIVDLMNFTCLRIIENYWASLLRYPSNQRVAGLWHQYVVVPWVIHTCTPRCTAVEVQATGIFISIARIPARACRRWLTRQNQIRHAT